MLELGSKNTKASARARTYALNYNFEGDWLIELSDNELSNNKLSNNKLFDNNSGSKLVKNRRFLNQSQSRKLWFLWLLGVIMSSSHALSCLPWIDVS